MAWEWVAPVATAVASIAVGVGGVFFTWLTGRQGREHAEAILAVQLSQDRLLASEARVQQRLETAYVDLLDMAGRAGQWAQMVLPMIDTNPPQPDPPLPTPEEQAHVEAVVRAFGSKEVRALMADWRGIVTRVNATVQQAIWEEADPRRASQRSPRMILEELRSQERTAQQALAEQIRAELRPAGWVESSALDQIEPSAPVARAHHRRETQSESGT